MFKIKIIFLIITLFSLTTDVVHGMWSVKGSCRGFFHKVWQPRWHRRHQCQKKHHGGHKHFHCGGKRYAFMQLWVDKAIVELKKDGTPITKDAIKKKLQGDPDFQKAWDDFIAKAANKPRFCRRRFWSNKWGRPKYHRVLGHGHGWQQFIHQKGHGHKYKGKGHQAPQASGGQQTQTPGHQHGHRRRKGGWPKGTGHRHKRKGP